MQLASALVGPSATAPTNHFLARLYVRGIVAFAVKFYPALLPTLPSGAWAFATPTPVQALSKGDPGADEAERTIHMDFENYTLGRLFDDRGNYDMNHGGHQAAVAHVRGVVWTLGWRTATFDALDRRIAEDAYRSGRGDRSPVERYGKKYGWIGFFTYAGILEDQGLLPHESPFSDVDIDPSFPEKPPIDGSSSVPEAWLSPSISSHESWLRACTTSLPVSVIRREAIGGHRGPWLAVHGNVSAEDRVLGRAAWAFLSAFVVSKGHEPHLVAALKAGARLWGSRDVPSDHYTFAGEIPWHPNFASVALAESAYFENVRVSAQAVDIEVLAHDYEWESYHSDMNRSGSARVPSRNFSSRFDLRGVAQSFDQVLPDGGQATITLSGVDGLKGDVIYVREDLLRQYVGDRAVVWFAFGERELRPYPPSPPQWLIDVQRQSINAWSVALTEADLTPRKAKSAAPKKKVTQKPTTKTRATAKAPKKSSAKKKSAGRKS